MLVECCCRPAADFVRWRFLTSIFSHQRATALVLFNLSFIKKIPRCNKLIEYLLCIPFRIQIFTEEDDWSSISGTKMRV